MEEIWKPVIGYEGLYEVSNLGRVRSVDRLVKYSNGQIHLHKGRILSPGLVHKSGYLQVALCNNGKTQHKMVYRLVAEAFLPNIDNLPQVNHKDENPFNNCVDNLEWCTIEYNINYGTRIQKVTETNIKNGHWDPNMCGLDKKEYEKRKRIKYRDRHNEANRRWREKNRMRKLGENQ